MKEIRDTEQAIDALMLARNVGPGEDTTPRAIKWAPGDMTCYTVALLRVTPLDPESREGLTEFLLVIAGQRTLIIPKPRNEFSFYSAELFLARHGEDYAGWWGGVRPILAGLGWTEFGNRHTKFSHNDANVMAQVMKRHGRNLT